MRILSKEFYLAALEDLITDFVSVEEIKDLIKDFEEDERYEVCSGLQRCLDFYNSCDGNIQKLKKEYKIKKELWRM